MNNYQKSRHESNKLVVKEARNYPESTNKIPAFKTGIDELDAINGRVEEIKKAQEQDIQGITTNKGYSEDDLGSAIKSVSGAVYAFARKNKDVVLMGKVSFTSSEIDKMGSLDKITTAELVLEEARKVPVASLTEAGISAAELTSFEEMIDSFKEISNAPREAIIGRSNYTENLRLLFIESNSILKGLLDKLAIQYKTKDPDFYLKYRAARNIIY